jgi:hypothetical protein
LNKLTAGAVGVLSLVLMVGGAPVAAQAADVSNIQAANYSGENPGIIHVSLVAADQVREIDAQFVDPDTGEVVGETTDFAFDSEYAGELRYVTRTPVVLPPAELYDVRVRVVDADGDVHTDDGAGRIVYRVSVTADQVAVNPASIDFDNRTVTVSGVLRGTWPGSMEVRPLGGFPVYIWGAYQGSDVDITSDADGSFPRTVTIVPGLSLSLEVSMGWIDQPQYIAGETQFLKLGVTPQATGITVRMDKLSAQEGDPVILKGKAQRLGVAGWVPAPANYTVVDVDVCHSDGTCSLSLGPVDLAEDGTFRIETRAFFSGYYIVRLRDNTGIYFTTSSARTKAITVMPAS